MGSPEALCVGTNVRFGSLAAVNCNISRMSAFGGKAAIGLVQFKENIGILLPLNRHVTETNSFEKGKSPKPCETYFSQGLKVFSAGS
jgi:hypothetical protein